MTLYGQVSWLSEHTKVVLWPDMSAGLFLSCFRVGPTLVTSIIIAVTSGHVRPCYLPGNMSETADQQPRFLKLGDDAG